MSSSAEEDEPDVEKGSEKLEAQDEGEKVRVGIRKSCTITIVRLSYHFCNRLHAASTYC